MKTSKSLENKKRIKKTRMFNRFLTVLLNLVPLVSAAVLVCAVFYFSKNNQTTIENQNAQYALDTAVQIGKHLEDDFEEAQTRTTNLSVLIRDAIEDDAVSQHVLYDLERRFTFDGVRFIDHNGIIHASGGRNIDVSDRDYFINGMKGISGVSVVYDSRVVGGTQIGFYTPVFKEGRVVGVARGIYYADSHLKKILSAKYFGVKTPAFLCDKDGMIIAGNTGNYADLHLDSCFITDKYADAEICSRIIQAINDRKSISIICNENLVADNVCVVAVSGTEYSFVQIFPRSITDSMVVEANKANAALLIIFIIIAIANIIAMFIRIRRRSRFLEMRNRDMVHVLTGIEYMIKEFIIIDLEKSIFRLTGIDEKSEEDFVVGDYYELSQKILKTIDDDGEAARMAYVLDADNLKEELSRKNGGRYETTYYLAPDAINVSTNVPISGWCNLVIQALSYDENGKAAMLLFMRGDITSIKEADQAKQDMIDKTSTGMERLREIITRLFSNTGRQLNAISDEIIAQANDISEGITENEAVNTAMQYIRESGYRLRTIGENACDMSVVQKGDYELNSSEYRSEDLSEDIKQHILAEAGRKGIGYIFEAAEGCPRELYGDLKTIEKIIFNLIDVAVDHSGQGTVRIRLSHTIMEEDKIALKVEILDETKNGRVIGSQKSEGSDIRLSVGRMLANLMESTFNVSNENGNTFTFVVMQKIIDM